MKHSCSIKPNIQSPIWRPIIAINIYLLIANKRKDKNQVPQKTKQHKKLTLKEITFEGMLIITISGIYLSHASSVTALCKLYCKLVIFVKVILFMLCNFELVCLFLKYLNFKHFYIGPPQKQYICFFVMNFLSYCKCQGIGMTRRVVNGVWVPTVTRPAFAEPSK